MFTFLIDGQWEEIVCYIRWLNSFSKYMDIIPDSMANVERIKLCSAFRWNDSEFTGLNFETIHNTSGFPYSDDTFCALRVKYEKMENK